MHQGFIRQFRKDPRFDIAAIPHLDLLVGYMEKDNRITDIRWMAYMLATAYWETSSVKKETVPVLDKHAKPRTDKNGRPLVRSRHRWCITMSPVAEVGHGARHNYFLPVKIKSLPDGRTRITEQDGDQFTVTVKGTAIAINKGDQLGAKATTKAAKSYTDDDGAELAYYGRGYVQLTFWSNYATSSAQLGMGLKLLLNPDLVMQTDTAYKIMAYGMITGQGFAHNHKLSDYFRGGHTDYIKARHMVNVMDKAEPIAKIADSFEKILLGAKAQTESHHVVHNL